MNDYRETLHKVEKETVKTLEAKYNMKLCGSGGSTMFGIELVSLSFDINTPVTIEEARRIIVGSAELCLKNLNNNKAIRPYFAEYPFSIKQLKLRFFFNSRQANSDDKHVSVFTVGSRRENEEPTVQYEVNDPQKILRKVLEEPYEKAKEIVNEENS